MYKLMGIVCVLLFFPAARSNAQRFNAFAGISYSGYGPDLSFYLQLPTSPKIRHSLYGWNGSFEVKVLPVLGIVADFNGNYGTETIGSLLLCRGSGPPPFAIPCTENTSARLYTFTFGPQVSLPLGRFKPYAHALFGAALYREFFQGAYTSDTFFADELGGGVDVSLIPRIAWRVQADALQTRFGSLQNSLRLSTGVVFRF